MTKHLPPLLSFEHSELLRLSTFGAFVILVRLPRDLFAFLEIELAGGEDRNGFDALDLFWNPQVWDAGIVKFACAALQDRHLRRSIAQALRLWLRLAPHDGNRALISSRQAEEIDDFAFDCFVRHHFAADL